MSLSRLIAVLACTLAVTIAAVAPAVSSTGAASSAVDVPATAAKSCSSGYTHAVMPDGSHKCLRVGQFWLAKARMAADLPPVRLPLQAEPARQHFGGARRGWRPPGRSPAARHGKDEPLHR
jgi:hypothetical protein